MKVLITGASGFIGRHVLRCLLDRGHQALALTRSPATLPEGCQGLRGGLGELDPLVSEASAFQPEACLHLAWEGIPDYSYRQNMKNLQYGLALVEFCQKVGVSTVVATGSCAEYAVKPHSGESAAHRESDPLSADTGFAASKNALRFMMEASCKETGIGFAWLRLFYVFGPGQRRQSLIPYMIDAFASGNIPKLAGVNNANDFIHVRDVARAIVQTMEAPPRERVLNIGAGTATRVSEIYRFISSQFHMGDGADTLGNADDGSGRRFCADMQTAWGCLDWRPEIPVMEGIRQMIFEEGSR